MDLLLTKVVWIIVVLHTRFKIGILKLVVVSLRVLLVEVMQVSNLGLLLQQIWISIILLQDLTSNRHLI